MAKVQSMTISEFMGKDKSNKRVSVAKVSIPTAIGSAATLAPVSAFAATPSEFMTKKAMDLIMAACEPIIEILQTIAYPAGIIGLTIAGIKMMLNQRDGSISAVQAVGIGYLMIQISPWFMDILKYITNGVS